MSKMIDFQRGKKMRIVKMKKEEEIRERKMDMFRRVLDQSEKTFQEIDAEFLDQISKKDPEAAEYMREYYGIAGQAEIARFRENGHNISGTEFEIRRDRKALEKARQLEKKIDDRLKKM